MNDASIADLQALGMKDITSIITLAKNVISKHGLA